MFFCNSIKTLEGLLGTDSPFVLFQTKAASVFVEYDQDLASHTWQGTARPFLNAKWTQKFEVLSKVSEQFLLLVSFVLNVNLPFLAPVDRSTL